MYTHTQDWEGLCEYVMIMIILILTVIAKGQASLHHKLC